MADVCTIELIASGRSYTTDLLATCLQIMADIEYPEAMTMAIKLRAKCKVEVVSSKIRVPIGSEIQLTFGVLIATMKDEHA